jgi:hypothetical protein
VGVSMGVGIVKKKKNTYRSLFSAFCNSERWLFANVRCSSNSRNAALEVIHWEKTRERKEKNREREREERMKRSERITQTEEEVYTQVLQYMHDCVSSMYVRVCICIFLLTLTLS